MGHLRMQSGRLDPAPRLVATVAPLDDDALQADLGPGSQPFLVDVGGLRAEDEIRGRVDGHLRQAAPPFVQRPVEQGFPAGGAEQIEGDEVCRVTSGDLRELTSGGHPALQKREIVPSAQLNLGRLALQDRRRIRVGELRTTAR